MWEALGLICDGISLLVSAAGVLVYRGRWRMFFLGLCIITSFLAGTIARPFTP